MNKLDELIQQLCPNGVPYRRLGDIATICRGGSFQKKDFTESGVPCIHYGQIYTRYGLFVNETITYIGEETAQKQKFAEPNDVVMAVTSENIEDVCKCVAWLGDGKVAVSGHAAIIHHSMNPKYLVYWLHSSSFYQQKAKIANGTKVIEVAPAKLSDVVLPVPPLEVQREIVRILDTFTELTAELTAELAARKQQYAYYRDNLLTFRVDITRKSLDELCTISAAGDAPKDALSLTKTAEYQIPVISNGIGENAFYGYTDKPKITEPAVTVAARGTIGYAEYRDYPYYPIIRLLSVIPKNTAVLATKYLYYCMQGKKYNVPLGGIPQLTAPELKKVVIPVPPLPVQQRIVTVLDNFDAICSDLNIGLPAEIEARKKQYEFYRDQLLTFAVQDEIVLTDRQTDRQTDEYNALIRLCQYVFGYVTLEISDICNISRGKVISKTDIMEQAGTYPVYSSQTENNGELGKIDSYMFDGEYVTWTTDGANAGTVFYRYGKFNITNVCGLLSVMDSSVLLEKYLFYFLQKNAGKYVNAGMGNPKLMSNVMASIKIDIPSLSEQKRIIAILDHFSTLCTDLTSGLPAEIEARQKQYEYYRDKLLSFTPAD